MDKCTPFFPGGICLPFQTGLSPAKLGNKNPRGQQGRDGAICSAGMRAGISAPGRAGPAELRETIGHSSGSLQALTGCRQTARTALQTRVWQ